MLSKGTAVPSPLCSSAAIELRKDRFKEEIRAANAFKTCSDRSCFPSEKACAGTQGVEGCTCGLRNRG